MTRPWTVLVGDCRARLADLDANSVDLAVSDAPYGLSTLLDSPNLERSALWRKILAHNRNRRPLRAYVGEELDAFLARESRAPTRDEFLDVVEAAERRRLLEGPALERLLRSWLDTGENPEIKGRGFMGREWDALVPAPNTLAASWRVLKPGAYFLTCAGARTDDLIKLSLRLALFEVDDQIMWLYGQGMPKRCRVDYMIDKHFGKHKERPIRGLSTRSCPRGDGLAGGKAFAAPEGMGRFDRGPATPEAAPFEGYDRGLRPGGEPVVVACKPLEGTVAENALAYGTGGLHVDACRIPRQDAGRDVFTYSKATTQRLLGGLGEKPAGHTVQIDPRGGYPANVVVDEEVAAEIDRQSGPCGGSGPSSGPTLRGPNGGRSRGKFNGYDGPARFHGRVDGASAFYRVLYTAKASPSEKDAGLEELGDGENPHETVKPIALMRWLVRLASPPGAWDPDESRRPLLLDPFAGSGSTLVAGLREGVRVLGCELAERYAEVARRRCQHAYALPREVDEQPRADGGDEADKPPRGAQATLRW